MTGAAAKGGKATIIWDESPTFTLGKMFSRKQISAALGGGEVDFLPTANGAVVCGCFRLDCNPEAPDIVIPGTGKVIERTAKLFCEQNYPVPIFIKRHTNEWEYIGDYKAERSSTDASDIAKHHKDSVTRLGSVSRVIFLKRADVAMAPAVVS